MSTPLPAESEMLTAEQVAQRLPHRRYRLPVVLRLVLAKQMHRLANPTPVDPRKVVHPKILFRTGGMNGGLLNGGSELENRDLVDQTDLGKQDHQHHDAGRLLYSETIRMHYDSQLNSTQITGHSHSTRSLLEKKIWGEKY